MLVDENQDILKRQKVIWNSKKMKYNKVLVNSDNKRIDGKDGLMEKRKD